MGTEKPGTTDRVHYAENLKHAGIAKKMKRIQALEFDILRDMQRADPFEINYSDIEIVDHDDKRVSPDMVRGHLYLLLDRNLVAEVHQNYWRITVAGYELLAERSADD